MSEKMWEYENVYVTDERGATLVEVLNQHGVLGWKFTGYAEDTGLGMNFLMMRKRREEEVEPPEPRKASKLEVFFMFVMVVLVVLWYIGTVSGWFL